MTLRHAAYVSIFIAQIILGLFKPAEAIIRASQLGDADWLQQYVGKVSIAKFAISGRPRAFVATESNIIACLNLRNGDIIWRQALDVDTDGLNQLLVLDHPGIPVVTLSGGGVNLRAWSSSNGALLWEHDLSALSDIDDISRAQQAPAAAAAEGDPSGARASDQAAFTPQTDSSSEKPAGNSSNTAMLVLPSRESDPGRHLVVCALGQVWGFWLVGDNADLEWRVQLQGWSQVAAVEMASTSAGPSLVALFDGDKQLAVAQLSVSGRTARLTQQSVVETPQLLKGPVVLWSDMSDVSDRTAHPAAAVLTADGSQLCTIGLKEEAELSCQTVPAGTTAASDSDNSPGASLLPLAIASRALLLQGSQGVTILQYDVSGQYRVGETHRGTTSASAAVQTDVGVMIAIGGRHDGAVWTKILNASTEALQVVSEEAVENLVPPDAAGNDIPVVALFLGSFRRKDGQPGYRVIVTLADATVALLQQGTLVWTRPEALADVARVRFADLPATATSATAGGGVPKTTLANRFRHQLLSLKDSVQLALPEEQREVRAYREAHSTKHLPIRDAKGFRRMVLVLASTGTLAALHCGSGRIMWSVYFGTAPGRATQAAAQLLPWRTSHDVHKAPQVLVLLPSPGGGTLAAAVDIYTGAVVMQRTLSLTVQQVLHVPKPLREGTDEQQVYLLLSPVDDTDVGSGKDHVPAVEVFPGGSAAIAAAKAAAPTMHFWHASLASGVVTGWGFVDSLAPQLRWSSIRPDSSPALLAAIARDPRESLHSSVKILDDRSLKIKHLNRHMVLLASGPPLGRVPADVASARLTVELVDAVTGHALFRQTHLGCHGPVHGVIAEHWAVYSFWNAVELRHQVVVIELYEEALTDRMQLLFGSSNRTASSYSLPRLEVLQGGWYWGTGVKAAAVTATARGIASKSLLLGTTTDQVYLMDKTYLDPRRPWKTIKEMTAAEQEERLLPNAPLLPLLPTSYATLSYQVVGLRGIATASAVMESATHMLAYGNDLMYIRLAPAASFDGLTADFPFALLVVLVATMTVASLVLRGFASRHDVKSKWE